MAFPVGGWEGEALVRADLSLADRWSAHAIGGVQRYATGALAPRDALVGARALLLSRDDLSISVAPRLSIPVGNVSDTFAFQPGSTGSFDPALGGDLVVGGKVLGVVEGQARWPLYAGADGVRQGPFARGDLRGAVRLGEWVAAVGTSTVLSWPSDVGTRGFTEFAATASASWTPFDRHGFGLQLRAPVWTNGENYRLAVALGWSAVWRRREAHGHGGA